MYKHGVISLLVFLLVINVNNSSYSYVNGMNDIELNPKAKLFSFKYEDIQNVQIRRSRYFKNLDKDEVKILITILNKINKENVEIYNGPGLKGRPLQCNIILKSGHQFSFVTNGNYLLIGDSKVFSSEFVEFVKQTIIKIN